MFHLKLRQIKRNLKADAKKQKQKITLGFVMAKFWTLFHASSLCLFLSFSLDEKKIQYSRQNFSSCNFI